jgi:hypothetical protein
MKVFFSWQSDLPNADNRTLLQVAIQSAIADLLESYPHLAYDEALQGEACSPRIDEKVLGK